MRPSGPRLRRVRGIAFWTVPAFARLGVRTAFFLRHGGGGRGPCAGLNLSLSVSDDPARVLANRARAAHAAGFQSLPPVLPLQVHGTRLLRVTRRHAGLGWSSQADCPQGYDALLTDVPGLPLAVAVADCLPVLIAADRGRAVAAVHAGWRGLAKGILPKAVRAFQRHWRIAPARLWAAIGPGIGPEAFTVRDQALAVLARKFPRAVSGRRGACAQFDLWQAAATELRRAGVPAGHIAIVRESTAGSPRRYFSHRRDQGRTGRMLGMVQSERKKGERA